MQNIKIYTEVSDKLDYFLNNQFSPLNSREGV